MTTHCRFTRKGQGVAYEATWATKMEPWIEQWNGAETDVHEPQALYDPLSYDAYLRWYHGATRVRLFPVPDAPEDHVPDITDTFATQPTEAFHLMVIF